MSNDNNYFSYVGIDIVCVIVEYLDNISLLRFQRVSKQIFNICNNYLPLPSIDNCLMNGDYQGINRHLRKSNDLNVTDCYKYFYNACSKGYLSIIELLVNKYNKYINWSWIWNKGLSYACCNNNNLRVIIYLSETWATDRKYGLLSACKYGHLDVVKLMIEGSTVLADVLYNASLSGNLDVVNFVLDYCHKRSIHIDWDEGIGGSCLGGHLHIVELMIEKGANNWDHGLISACTGGHINIANLMIEKGATDINAGFLEACRCGELNIINFMIENGATDIHGGFLEACRYGKLDIINFLIDKGADNYTEGFLYACKGGHLDIINLMVEKGADYSYIGLVDACISGNIAIVKLIIEKCVHEKDDIIFNRSFSNACMYGYLDIIHLLIENGANDCDQNIKDIPIGKSNTLLDQRSRSYLNWNHGLYYACVGKHLSVIKLMIEKGANDWNQALMGTFFNEYYFSYAIDIISINCINIYIIELLFEKGANNINELLIRAKQLNNLQIIEFLTDYQTKYL